MEKNEQIIVRDEEVSSRISSSNSDAQSWVTGFRRRFPWLGFGALVMILLATVGQVLILALSNKKSATQWPSLIRPNVCLSILNSVSTLSITLAIGQGIAIAWWRKALRGATVKELHNGWSFGSSFASIFLNLKSFNVIALAALTAKVAIIDGVLFQRSTSTYVDFNNDYEEADVLVWASQKMPITGVMGGDSPGEGYMTYNYSSTLATWLDYGSGLNSDDDSVFGCDGAWCEYGLNGTGFSIDCDSKTEIDDYVNLAPKEFGTSKASSNLTMFWTQFDLISPSEQKNYSWIKMAVKYPEEVDDTKCPTRFTTYTCELRPAVLNYTVTYVNASSVMRSALHDKPTGNPDQTGGTSEGSGSWLYQDCSMFPDGDNSDACGQYNKTWQQVAGVHVLEIQDVYEPLKAGENSTLLGIYQALQSYLGSRADLTYSNKSWLLEQTGVFAPYLMLNAPDGSNGCNYFYEPPMQQLLQKTNTLMLMTAVDADLYPDQKGYERNSDGTKIWTHNQRSEGIVLFKDIHYQSNYKYMFGALAATIVVVICILPSYWGFWQLGRKVTLGPIEIAYAFQGPALNPNHQVGGHTEDVLNAIGHARVQYNEADHEEGGRLRAFRTV